MKSAWSSRKSFLEVKRGRPDDERIGGISPGDLIYKRGDETVYEFFSRDGPSENRYATATVRYKWLNTTTTTTLPPPFVIIQVEGTRVDAMKHLVNHFLMELNDDESKNNIYINIKDLKPLELLGVCLGLNSRENVRSENYIYLLVPPSSIGEQQFFGRYDGSELLMKRSVDVTKEILATPIEVLVDDSGSFRFEEYALSKKLHFSSSGNKMMHFVKKDPLQFELQRLRSARKLTLSGWCIFFSLVLRNFINRKHSNDPITLTWIGSLISEVYDSAIYVFTMALKNKQIKELAIAELQIMFKL